MKMSFELRLKALYNQKMIIQESERIIKVLQEESQKLKTKIRQLGQDIAVKKKQLMDAI